MFEIERREVIRALALGLTTIGTMDADAAQHVHTATGAEKSKGPYRVKAFQPHEYKTIQRLAEIIVPADEVSGSALDAGAPEFIDTLAAENPQLAGIFHGGLAWLDAEMRQRYGTVFTGADTKNQTAMLDILVAAEREESARRNEELVYRRSNDYRQFSNYTVKRPSPLGPGITFFDWVRKMTVDAFYTSPIGIKDIDFRGNKGMARYVVPKESIDWALSRSPFKSAAL
ncbi:MAG: gluconate 2-dehydrogenase subunit 3 family protein [Acidobacteria bacterium]|nr:gluconate 2-dehydrogenase subunit 3 family protein [Acidobacteriota bacterium]